MSIFRFMLLGMIDRSKPVDPNALNIELPEVVIVLNDGAHSTYDGFRMLSSRMTYGPAIDDWAREMHADVDDVAKKAKAALRGAQK